MHSDPSFGVWLKERRKLLDLTQDALAEQAGCSTDMVRKIESGIARPSRQLAELLLTSLQIAPQEQSPLVKWARTGQAPLASPPTPLLAAPSALSAPTVPAPPTVWADFDVPVPGKQAESEVHNPYKGLRAFQEGDAPDFFGRDSLTARLLPRLA